MIDAAHGVDIDGMAAAINEATYAGAEVATALCDASGTVLRTGGAGRL